MLHALHDLLAPAMLERLTLLANHILSSERVATERLSPHAGKALEMVWTGLPGWLPGPPSMVWRITPAGLLEWQPQAAGPHELTLTVDAGQPLALAGAVMAGQVPPADIRGDAALAADVSWLMQNLRWDLAADVDRLFPPPVAAAVVQAGSVILSLLRAALSRLQPTPR
jgi:ubiquinone biosynthesis protein UbiJ